MGKRELIALLNLSSWCLVMVERLFLAAPRGCLQFVIVVFPDHTHLLFFKPCSENIFLTVPRWLLSMLRVCHTFLSVHYSFVVTCWERVNLLALLCVIFVVFLSLSLSYGVLGQVWYLIVSIPDLCLLTYFYIFAISTEISCAGPNILFIRDLKSYKYTNSGA